MSYGDLLFVLCTLCFVVCAWYLALGTWRLVRCAALPPSVRKASGFPSSLTQSPRLRRRGIASKSYRKGSRKAVGFPHGGRQSRTAYQAPSTKLQALSTRHKSQLSWHCLSLIKRCSCQGREYRSDQMKCANLQPKRIGKEAERNKLRRTSK